MAADSTDSSADSYVGSFISLISKAEIRYEGFLFHINPQESTIGLRNVQSYGMEGRRKDGPQVLPNDKVYEYIFFRGSDIKDLQVISSPPVQSTTAIPNDPAIIQSHYPCLTSASSSFPPASPVPGTNSNSNTQLGLPNSTFQGNPHLNQPVGSLGSWSSLPPPTANGNGFSMPAYWPGHSGFSGGVFHLQQQSLFQPPQGLPMSPLVQQQMQNPTTNTSLPGDASNFAEFSRPMLPTVGIGSQNLTSTMPPPSALLSNVPTRQSAALPSKLSPNLMPNNASNDLPTVTLVSNSPMISPLTTSSLDVNPVTLTVMDKPKPVFDSVLPYQAISQSMPSIVGVSSPVHSETSIPSLLTAGQLLLPGPTGQSSTHLQTAHRDIEVVQASTSESLSSDSESAKNPAELFPSPSAAKLNGAPLHFHHSDERHVQGRGNTLNKTAPHTHHSERDHARGKGNWLNEAALCSHHSYRGHARGRANVSHHSYRGHARGRSNVMNGAALHPHQSNRGHSRGRENGPNTAPVPTHRSDRGHGWRNATEVSPTTTKFTEDFNFEAMNEKFNKEDIWGHLGKNGKTRLEDDEGEENNNDANDAEDEDEDGLMKIVVKSFYVKDDFFDSLSCNSLDHKSGRGGAKPSEQKRIDIETFGEIPRRRRGHSSQGGPEWRQQSQGSYRGRGYDNVGRGRGRTVWCRVT